MLSSVLAYGQGIGRENIWFQPLKLSTNYWDLLNRLNLNAPGGEIVTNGGPIWPSAITLNSVTITNWTQIGGAGSSNYVALGAGSVYVTNSASASNITARFLLVMPDGSTMTNAANAAGLTNLTTVVSNGLYSLISGGGINAAQATNIASYFNGLGSNYTLTLAINGTNYTASVGNAATNLVLAQVGNPNQFATNGSTLNIVSGVLATNVYLYGTAMTVALGANALTAGSVTVTNTMGAATGDFVTLNGGSGTFTNTFGIGTADVNVENAGSVTVTNTASGATGDFVILNGGSGTLTNTFGIGTADVNTANIGSVTITNVLGAATGDFVTLNGGTITGTNSASFQAGATSAGTISSSGLTVTNSAQMQAGFTAAGSGNIATLTGTNAASLIGGAYTANGMTNGTGQSTNFTAINVAQFNGGLNTPQGITNSTSFTTNVASIGTADAVTANVGGLTVTNTASGATGDFVTLNGGSGTLTNTFGVGTADVNNLNAGTVNATNSAQFQAGLTLAGTANIATGNFTNSAQFRNGLTDAGTEQVNTLNVTNTASAGTGDFVTLNGGSGTLTNTFGIGTADVNTLNAGSATVTNAVSAATGNFVALNGGTITGTNSASLQVGATSAGTISTAGLTVTNSAQLQAGFTATGADNVATLTATNAALFIGGLSTPQGSTNSVLQVTNNLYNLGAFLTVGASTNGGLVLGTNGFSTPNGMTNSSSYTTNTATVGTLSATTADAVTLNAGSGTITNTLGVATVDATTLNSGSQVNTNNFQQLGNSYFNGSLYGTNASLSTLTNVAGDYRASIIFGSNSYQIKATDNSIIVTNTGAITLTMPYILGSGAPGGQILNFYNSGSAAATLQAGVSNTIGGTATNFAFPPSTSGMLYGAQGGSNWIIRALGTNSFVSSGGGGGSSSNFVTASFGSQDTANSAIFHSGLRSDIGNEISVGSGRYAGGSSTFSAFYVKGYQFTAGLPAASISWNGNGSYYQGIGSGYSAGVDGLLHFGQTFQDSGVFNTPSNDAAFVLETYGNFWLGGYLSLSNAPIFKAEATPASVTTTLTTFPSTVTPGPPSGYFSATNAAGVRVCWPYWSY